MLASHLYDGLSSCANIIRLYIQLYFILSFSFMVAVPTPSVAVSLNFQIMGNDSLQLTCNVQLDGLQGFIPLVETSWFFDRNTSNGMEYELIPNVSSSQMSAVKVVSCGERYSSDLRLVQLVVPSGTNEVVCEASVSLPNENHVISSLGKGGISIQDVVQGQFHLCSSFCFLCGVLIQSIDAAMGTYVLLVFY